MERHRELRLLSVWHWKHSAAGRALSSRSGPRPVDAMATQATDFGFAVAGLLKLACWPWWNEAFASTSLGEALAGLKIWPASPPPSTCDLPGPWQFFAGHAFLPCICAILLWGSGEVLRPLPRGRSRRFRNRRILRPELVPRLVRRRIYLPLREQPLPETPNSIALSNSRKQTEQRRHLCRRRTQEHLLYWPISVHQEPPRVAPPPLRSRLTCACSPWFSLTRIRITSRMVGLLFEGALRAEHHFMRCILRVS